MVFRTPHPLDEEGRCGLCRRGLNPFDAVYSFGFYEGALRDLVHLFKYGRVASLAEPLGEMMLRVLPRHEAFDLIVPMPMHWWRRWQRGFNQAELLARRIARSTGVPVKNPLRRRATAPQAGLSHARRRANVAGAFRVKPRVRLDGRRILLVDDVFTTGATAGACAATLKKAGAARVVVLSLARTDHRQVTEPLPNRAGRHSPVVEAA